MKKNSLFQQKLHQKVARNNNPLPEPVLGMITDTHITANNIQTVLSIFRQFIETLQQLDIKVAVHLGDWFTDRSSQTMDCLLAVKQVFNMFVQAGIMLYTIGGNHDKQNLKSAKSYLDIYDLHDHNKVKIVYTCDSVVLPSGNLGLHFLPYFKEGDEYLSKLAEIENQANWDAVSANILFTHIAVNGVRNNDGSLVSEGIAPEHFESFTKVFVGHYHDRSIVGENVVYIGSAYQANYGEDENKGFTILYTDGSFEQYNSEFKKFVKVYCKAADKAEARALLQRLQESNQTDKERIRIVFTGSPEELESIDRKSFEQLGVEVKGEVTTDGSNLSFAEIEALSVTKINKAQLIKYFNEYSKAKDFSKEQKITALTYLKDL